MTHRLAERESAPRGSSFRWLETRGAGCAPRIRRDGLRSLHAFGARVGPTSPGPAPLTTGTPLGVVWLRVVRLFDMRLILVGKPFDDFLRRKRVEREPLVRVVLVGHESRVPPVAHV